MSSSNADSSKSEVLGERLLGGNKTSTAEVSAMLTEQEKRKTPVNSERTRELFSELRPKFPYLSDDELKQKITTILTYMVRDTNASTSVFKYNTDQDLIAKISGGLALRGIHLGMSPQMLEQCPERTLLCPPTRESLVVGPLDSYKETVFQYSGAGIGKQFIKQVKNSGMNIATAASFSGFGATMGASGGKKRTEYCSNEKMEQIQVNDAGAIHCLYVPKAAFQIRREDIVLTPEVVKYAEKVQDSKGAVEFLRLHGSHVSTGFCHIGGVFFSSVHLKSDESASSSTLQDVASKQLNSKIKAGYSDSAVSAGLEVSYDDFDKNATNTQKEGNKKTAKSCMEVNAIGPATNNPEQFRQLLEDKESWQIIDRGYAGQAIGVWDLLLDEGLVATAELIRNTWLNIAEKYPDSIIFQVEKWQDVFKMAKFQSTILEILKPAKEINLISDSLLLEALQKAYSTIFENENHNYIVELFRMYSFRRILDELFQSSLHPQSQQFIASILDANTRKCLEDNKIKFSTSVMSFLKEEPSIRRSNSIEMDYSWESIPTLLCEYEKLPNGPIMASAAIRKAIEKKSEYLLPPQNLKEILERYSYDLEAHDFRYSPSSVQLKCLAIDILSNLKNEADHAFQEKESESTHGDSDDKPLFSVIQHTNQLNSASLCLVDFTVDGKLDETDQERIFIEKLRNRLELFVKSSNSDDEGPPGYSAQSVSVSSKSVEISSLETMLNVLSRCTLSGQMELFKLLITQRYSIPLIVTKTFSSSEPSTFYYIEAIRHIQATLPGGKHALIGCDINLPRVTFVSESSYSLSAEMCQEVCQCAVFSKVALKTDTYSTIVELAIGFIPYTKDKETAQLPCIVLYVNGNYLDVADFLGKVSDVIVVEVDEKDSNSFNDLRQRHIGDKATDIWQWKNSISELQTIGNFVTGKSQKRIAEKFQSWIYRLAKKEWQERTRIAIIDIETGFIRDKVDFSTIDKRLDSCDFSGLRKSFVLQNNFKQIVKRQYELYSAKDQIKRNQIEAEIETLRQEYSSTAKHTLVPILQLFCEILKIEDKDARILALSYFQDKIDQNSHQLLDGILCHRDEAFNEYQKLKNASANKDEIKSKLKAYRKLQQKCVNIVVQLEHLWRELSHIHALDEMRNTWIAHLAAQHLLDGFPLELVDGDAGLMSTKWVNAVFHQLEKILKKQLGKEPSIYTQATLGAQSSGKSTFCNTAYGTRMRTSVGQCTRGIYVSVVKARRRLYDFLIQFDTEGLCSPETYGLPGEEARDNRLAFYAILSSDSCVLITNGEDTNTLSNVIPVVMLAFNSSMLAKENGGRNASTLSLIYTRVDLAETQKLKTNTQKFLTDIDKASQELIARTDVEHCKHLNLRLEEGSIYHLGFLNEGSEPPKDKPNFDYGKRASNMREKIVSKALRKSWKTRSLINQAKYLELVTNCILSNNFELNFASFVEYDSYQKFKNACAERNFSITAKYVKKYEILEKQLLTSKENAEDLLVKLREGVRATIEENELQLEEELKNSELKKWKTEALSGFKVLLQSQDIHYSNLIKNAIEMRDGVDAKVKYYAAELRKKIRERFAVMKESRSKRYSDQNPWVQAYNFSMSSMAKEEKEKSLKDCFRIIFENEILDKVKIEYSPTANAVPSTISKLYMNNVDRFVNANQYTNKSVIKSPTSPVKSFFSKSKEAESFKLAYELDQEIRNRMLSVNRYQDDVVLEIIEATRKKFSSMHNEDALKAHCMCHNRLIETLQKKQETWDEKHNLFKIMQRKEGELGDYFIGIALGYSMEQVLTNDILNILKSNMHSAFREYAMSQYFAHIALNISSPKYNWIVDAAKLGAHVSSDIIQQIESENIEKVLEIVRNRAEHHNKIVSELLACQLTDDFLEKFWTGLKAIIIGVSNLSIIQAENRNVKHFIRLLSGKISMLPFTLAQAFNTLSKQTYQSEEVDLQKIVESIKDWINETHRQKNEAEALEIATLLMKKLRCRDLGGSINLRCNILCPGCGASCTEYIGHETKHTADHTPGGLRGIYHQRNNRLDETSCYQSVKENRRIYVYHLNETKSYKDFEDVFPDWKLPAELGAINTETKVLQYIFKNYQKELAEYYKRSPAENIPLDYNYTLKFLKEEAEKLIGI